MKRMLFPLAGVFLSSASAIAPAQEGAGQYIVERAIHVCASCHGEGGNSAVAVYPKLAGQQPLYTAQQLKLFRAQKRSESNSQAYMWGVSALLDDATIQGLSDYYAAQKPSPGRTGNAKLAEQGRKIYEQGIASRNIRACASCHGENGEGASVFPRLAGQHADYLLKQLKEFRTPLRPLAVHMAEEVRNMTSQEMQAVAVYLQSK